MQIGFVVALLAEVNVPAEGLFGAWDGHSLSVFGASASFLIACAAVRVLSPSQRTNTLGSIMMMHERGIVWVAREMTEWPPNCMYRWPGRLQVHHAVFNF